MRFTCASLLALVIGLLFLGGKKEPAKPIPYSFTKEPFINPRIINDLSCWWSDHGDQVVAINLLDSQKSNRYFANMKVTPVKGGNPFVSVDDKDGEDGRDNGYFGYQYIGETESGVHVLRTSESGGGSGVFEDVLLLKFEWDYGTSEKVVNGVVRLDRERLLLKKVGTVGLGDRYEGKLEVNGDQLIIGRDTGRYEGTTNGGGRLKDQVIQMDFTPPK